MEFCLWLSNELNEKYSLPTEAQWEKACKGCSGQMYPWKSQEKELYDEPNDWVQIRPIGERFDKSTPFGCLDFWTNVSEWCLDWYDYYDPNEVRNPLGPSLGKHKVYRGGTKNTSGWPRCSYHKNNQLDPDKSHKYLGFRVVCND